MDYGEFLKTKIPIGQLDCGLPDGERTLEACWLSDAVREILSDIENYGE